MSARRNGGQLWLVRRLEDNAWHLFAGTLEEVVSRINWLHRDTGKKHSAKELV